MTYHNVNFFLQV